MAAITASTSWVRRYKLGRPVFGELLPFFSADPLKVCQVGWGASTYSYFQVSRDVRSGSSLDCLLRVIVLLEGEPSPQSEVLGALEQVFIKDLSVLCCVHLSLEHD